MASKWSSSKSILVGSLIVVLLLIGSIVWRNYAPSPYDAFAQCLSENGAFVYEAYWCSHCAEQEEQFGSAYRYIDQKECAAQGSTNLDLCQDDGITGTPTWENTETGERRGGRQSMEDLAEWFGCELPDVE